jgi:hypothetical protein
MFAIALLAGGCASPPPVASDAQTAGITASRLRTFRSMAEFEAYRDRVRTLGKHRNVLWSQVLPHPNAQTLLAQNDAQPCDPTLADCDRTLQEAIVTAQRRSVRQSSITNNQEADIDEGDIVKQFGRFLIVLQDGRLFCIDTASPGASLHLADRLDIYSSPEDEVWYDELLINGNNLVVTGYNYGEEATEINLIAIDAAGHLELRARYYIESDDYYSGKNYTSRLAHGQFVVYTPIDISEDAPLTIPRIRSWTPAGGLSEWRPLFDIKDVYLPIQQTLTPMLHVVSVCRVDEPEAFHCRSRGVVGSPYAEMYVAPDNVYLWLSSDFNEWGYGERWPDACPKDVDRSSRPALPATVFQIPIAGGSVRAAHAIGVPTDQFAFDEREDRLLALLRREPVGCYLEESVPMIFASIPLHLFGASPQTLRADAVVPLPEIAGWELQNRYSSNYLVYGTPQGYWWSEKNAPAPEPLFVVPIADPASYSLLHAPHTVERIEVIGDNAVAVGFAAPADLGVSTIELRTQPHLAGSLVLPGVQESEGRSHAFNSLIADDGSGLLGLPTSYRSRARWDAPADVQFFAADPALELTQLGELAGTSDVKDDYSCEVSCIDWYGNARPIFVDGRVFALNESELIEGEVRAGSIVEIGRLRITGEPDPRPAIDGAARQRIRIRPEAPLPPPPPPATEIPPDVDWLPTR